MSPTPTMQELSEDWSRCSGRYAMVAARFNAPVTEPLVDAAANALGAAGMTDVRCVWVPGAFEIPMTCRALIERGDVDAIIALGAVIRGETPHFDYVAAECARGIARLNERGTVPVIFGVLTTDTAAQAKARIPRGADAAHAAMHMVSLLRRLRA